MEYRANCVLPLCVKEPEARLCPFYTDSRVIDGFKQYIKALLNHVNRYSGIALKDDPAIMGWETGK
jgi:mannan endo-1,4-beta-mannosidase